MDKHSYTHSVTFKTESDGLICIGVHLSHDCSKVYTIHRDGTCIYIGEYSMATLKQINIKKIECATGDSVSINSQNDILAIHSISYTYIYRLSTCALLNTIEKSFYGSDFAFPGSLECYMRCIHDSEPGRNGSICHCIRFEAYKIDTSKQLELKYITLDRYIPGLTHASNDGLTMIKICDDRDYILWDLPTNTHKTIRFDYLIHTITFSSDGAYIAIRPFRIKMYEQLSYIHIYNVKDPSVCIMRLPDRDCCVYNLCDFIHISGDIYKIVLRSKSSNIIYNISTIILGANDSIIGEEIPEQDIIKTITWRGTSYNRYLLCTSSNDTTFNLYTCLKAPFKPSLFYMHPYSIQQLVIRVFMLAAKLEAERCDLSFLPTEIWLLIINMFKV